MVAVAYDEKRWSFTRSFDRESFGVLDKWSVIGDSRLRELVAQGSSTVYYITITFFSYKKKTLRGNDNNHFRFILD